ncbi:MAG: nitrite/sulfite reductase [Desulfuromonadales bacterium]|nr:nitrite/sulfite reductase [Desulfuromonadales bacterium]
MNEEIQKLRLRGVYPQDSSGRLMVRVKLAAGLLDSDQAQAVARLGEQFGSGRLHLTCRGSIEFHDVRIEQLDSLFAELERVGLTTRGACGGAVRGISCATGFGPGFAAVQALAEHFTRHFAGNPEFEGLPKKFKVAIEAGYQNARHLIQDVGLVLTTGESPERRYDVWCAGGLGREPQAAIPFATGVAENQLLPLVEAIVAVYRQHTPPPKRLKFLLNLIGEEPFRVLVATELANRPRPVDAPPLAPAPLPFGALWVELPVFAGELPAKTFGQLAVAANELATGVLLITSDQNIVIPLAAESQSDRLQTRLSELGIDFDDRLTARLRVCPGNHECRMGLVATRELAGELHDRFADHPVIGRAGSLAISGCRNSCSQPQLAGIGIMTSGLQTGDNGERQALFTLYRRQGDGLGQILAADLDRDQLFRRLHSLAL